MRDKVGNLVKMGTKLIKFLNVNKLTVTRGNNGAVLF